MVPTVRKVRKARATQADDEDSRRLWDARAPQVWPPVAISRMKHRGIYTYMRGAMHIVIIQGDESCCELLRSLK